METEDPILINVEEQRVQEDIPRRKCTVEIRSILAVLGFLAFVCMFAMRVNLSVAIVAMTKEQHIVHEVVSESCPFPDDYFSEPNSTSSGEFIWDEKTQGLILGSFYYAYGLANIIGGRASEHFGGRLVAGVGITASGILTILSPVAARTSIGFLIALRVLQGCLQGLAFPAINTLIAKWYTTKERSKFASFILAGMDFGNVITFAASGWLCESDFFGGWSSTFYIPGIFTLIWGILWFSLVRDDPKKHPLISEKELSYITEGCPDTKEKCPFPWVSVAKSKHFWSIVIVQLGSNWGYFIILTQLPTYLDRILHVQMMNNGIISAIPYLATWLFSVFYGIVVDKAISGVFLNILSVRRLSMCIAGYGPMLCMVAMCFVNCNGILAFTVLLIIGIFNGAVFCGYFSSHADIAPRFAGTLMGLTNAIGGIAGFAGPTITGIILEYSQTLNGWRLVFIVCALVYGVTTTVYEIFITAESQPWNEPKRKILNDEVTSLTQTKR